MNPGLADLADFSSTSNFDLWYFCSLLTYKNAQYLIWKILFIYVRSLKPKAVIRLLKGFMLGQSTPISYHTQANGCIFFAPDVSQNLNYLKRAPQNTLFFSSNWPLGSTKIWVVVLYFLIFFNHSQLKGITMEIYFTCCKCNCPQQSHRSKKCKVHYELFNK